MRINFLGSLAAISLVLVLSCSSQSEPDTDTNQVENVEEWPMACNNTTVRCPDGYAEGCTNGATDCVESESGTCLENALCECSTRCDEFSISGCDGDANCTELEACGQVLFCTTCDQPPTCGDREILTTTDCANCRDVACLSDPTLIYYCGRADDSCVSVPCPVGSTPCAAASETCVEVETCGELRLCEPA